MLASLAHHAYGIAGLGSMETVLHELERLGIRTKGNPDVRVESFETFGVDEARALKEAAERTAVTGGKKVFVVSAAGLTREAQNALLKIFEEPPSETHFFLLVPSCALLLPTLRSRLFLVRPERGPARVSERASAFLKNSAPLRLKTVQSLLKKAEDDESKTDLILFLDELEVAAAYTKTKDRAALQGLLETKKYARDRAPSYKLLLEHLALVLPVCHSHENGNPVKRETGLDSRLRGNDS